MRKVKLLLICLFIFFLFTNTLTAEVPETEKAKSLEENTYAGLLNSYKETHMEIIAKLEYAKKNIPEIKRLLNEMKSIDKLMAKNIKNPEQYNKYMEKYNKLNNSFFEKFGTALRSIWLHFPKFSMEKEPQKLDEVIKVIISLYKDTLTCFDNNAYSGTIKNCESLKKLCVNYGSDDGNMYYYELTKDLELHKVDVSANYPSWFGQDNITDVVLKDNFYFCRILTMTASPFAPKILAQNNAGLSFIENFYGSVLPYPEIFKKICINKKPSEQIVLRLFELQTQYPNESNLKRFSEQYEKWQSECGKATQKICAESYVIKDKVILAYETVGCTIREVTKEDVESDIRLMDSHADKLKQSTLLDAIDICQQAYDNGFFWGFKKPELSKKCKKENNEAKTKNRPVK